ncbi:hypothetical protein LOK49_LG11G00805 [Camellia lanceoleosa]|uniref:Uncharacterized protein n=1 Tax=Camellia lanceoleosa TaxID=1840588 RepID=A0ACC0G397_9ERIC|nr:hypothetical protein LOK49_LG11G00805 [Camellia lanceoleosa]
MTFKEQEHFKPKRVDATNSTGGESSGGASKASGIGKEEIITANVSNTIALPTGRDSELSSPQKICRLLVIRQVRLLLQRKIMQRLCNNPLGTLQLVKLALS